MDTIPSTLFHRVLEPASPGEPPFPTLVFLHGRGADEEDLLGIMPSLDPRLLVVSARAPYPFAYGKGFTWYDVGQGGTPQLMMFNSSYDKLLAFLQDARRNYPVDPTRLFLFGFSMGTVMSYTLALTQPQLIRGVVAHSGYVPEETDLIFRWRELGQTEFFVAHGIHDPIIPIHLAQRAQELLSQAKARFTYREYPMAHQISEESLADASAWLQEQIDQATDK